MNAQLLAQLGVTQEQYNRAQREAEGRDLSKLYRAFEELRELMERQYDVSIRLAIKTLDEGGIVDSSGGWWDQHWDTVEDGIEVIRRTIAETKKEIALENGEEE